MYHERFRPSVRGSGERLHGAGHVAVLDLEPEYTCAVVSAGVAREVEVEVFDLADPAAVTFGCTCGREHGYCEHAFATLAAIDELIGHAEDGADARYRGAGGHDGREPAVAERWQDRLREVVERTARPARQAGDAPLVVEWLLRIALQAGQHVLVVDAVVRRRRKDGSPGRQRRAALARSELDALPGCDQELLELAERADDFVFGVPRHHLAGHGAARRRLEVPSGWVVDDGDLVRVLELLQQTGRTSLHGAERGAPAPVRIDLGRPYELGFALRGGEGSGENSGENGVLSLAAVLRRGDVELALESGGTLAATLAAAPDHGLCVFDGALGRYERVADRGLMVDLLHNGAIVVAAAERDEFLEQLGRLPGAREVIEPLLGGAGRVVPEVVVTLNLPNRVDRQVAVWLSFDYGGELVEADDRRAVLRVDGALVRRDHAHEQGARDLLAEAGVELLAGRDHHRLDNDRILSAVAVLLQRGVRVLAEGHRVRPFLSGQTRVASGQDWFDVHAEVAFDGYVAGLPELVRRRALFGGFVRLGDGSLGILPDAWLRQVENLELLHGEVTGEALRVDGSRGLLLDAMLSSREADVSCDEQFARLRRRLREFTALRPAAAGPGFAGTLRPYQQQGLAWLRFLHEFSLGGCLADDMGLGKTVQVLALLSGLPRPRRLRDRRPHLVVAPRSLLDNWAGEARRFAPGLTVLEFSGSDRWERCGDELARHDVVLTTYGLLRNDITRFEEVGLRFGYVVLDETQAIKNGDSQVSKAVRLLRSEHRLALTGTPVENHIGELWALFEFLNPGLLGRQPAFRALFSADASVEQLQRHRNVLQRALRPVMLRRTKAQVLADLPEKVEQTLWCELEAPQRRRYDELRAFYRQRLLEGAAGASLEGRQKFQVLEALLRLRQAACHEGLLDERFAARSSAKFDALLPMLEELAAEDHKMLVFSQFTQLLDLLEPELRARQLAFTRLDGRTRKREERVRRFQEDPSCRVFLISLKAGGYGLNLTAADYVFVLDPWWNPAVEMQAIDRAHRLGQRRTVHAYRLICKGTVEERVLALQQEKKALCEAILGNERSLLQQMTRADLELLLG